MLSINVSSWLRALSVSLLCLSWLAAPPAARAQNAAPTNVVATGGDGQVLLTWTPVTNATGYNIYRGTSSSGEASSPINSSPAPSNFFLDNSANDGGSGPTNNTTYYYKVAAVFASGPQSANSTETSTEAVAQDGNWTVTAPSNSQPVAPNIGSNTLSFGQSLGTTLMEEASISGTTTATTNQQAEANYAGTWTFTWKGNTWPTLYVLQHIQMQGYSATVNNGNGTTTVSNTSGGTLASATYPITGTALNAEPTLNITYNTSDLTCPVQTMTSTDHLKGSQTSDGTATGTTSGWSETVNNSTVVQNAYTQTWFQSHFSAPTNIVLTFTVPTTDITVNASLSNSTSSGTASAQASASDVYVGN